MAKWGEGEVRTGQMGMPGSSLLSFGSAGNQVSPCEKQSRFIFQSVVFPII